MFAKSLYAMFASILLSGAVLPTLATDPNLEPEREIVTPSPLYSTPADSRIAASKGFIVPECSGDPSTPKPAFCSNFGHPGATLSNGTRPVAYKRGLKFLERRATDERCSGDLSTSPRGCFGRQPHPLPFTSTLISQRSDLSELSVAKRIVILRCSGDPATIPADCFTKPPRPSVNGHPFLELRSDGMSGIDLAKRIIADFCTEDPKSEECSHFHFD